jgi:hypothetical protein
LEAYLGLQVACKIITNQVKVIAAVNCITQLLKVLLVTEFTAMDHPFIIEPDKMKSQNEITIESSKNHKPEV